MITAASAIHELKSNNVHIKTIASPSITGAAKRYRMPSFSNTGLLQSRTQPHKHNAVHRFYQNRHHNYEF